MKKRIMVVLVAVILAVLGWLSPQKAMAQSADEVDSWKMDYTVNTDGVVHVSETLVWRFGDSSGRHGIKRTLLTREPDGQNSNQDVVYTINNIQVSSPDAPASFRTDDQATKSSPRERYLTITIGDANTQITAPTATYTLTYDIHGALRTFDDKPEFDWDLLNDQTPEVSNVTATVTVPGGVQNSQCYMGAAQSKDPCTSSTVSNGVSTFTQTTKPEGDILTIGTQMGAGLVSNATPNLQPKAKSPLVTGLQTAGTSAGVTAVLGALYLIWIGRRRRDERFAGLPPGSVPDSPQSAAVVPASRHDTIPVRYSPPDVPVPLGGLLIDGEIGARETSATLVDLAVRGALQLRNDAEQGTTRDPKLYARLVNPAVATQPFEQQLILTLFGRNEVTRPSGLEIDLSKPGALTDASDELSSSVSDIALGQGLMHHVGPVGGSGVRQSSFSGSRMIWIVVLLLLVLFPTSAGIASLLASPAVAIGIGVVVPLIVIGLVYRYITRRGQRTATGRALTDQVDGFYTYLNTAEADQIRFEEGEDIFSRYLPWAIAFGIADRWAKVCQKLVEMGRLPATAPGWYYGNPYMFSYGYFAGSALSSMNTAVAPPPPPPSSSSGSGFGSGSSFFGGGGGFAGGGGGGGGAGSW